MPRSAAVERYRVVIKKLAAKELEEVSGKADRRRLAERIEALADDPRPNASEKLSGTSNKYRIRQGTYRVLYLIDDAGRFVTVVRIAHRKDVYR